MHGRYITSAGNELAAFHHILLLRSHSIRLPMPVLLRMITGSIGFPRREMSMWGHQRHFGRGAYHKLVIDIGVSLHDELCPTRVSSESRTSCEFAWNERVSSRIQRFQSFREDRLVVRSLHRLNSPSAYGVGALLWACGMGMV